MVTKELNMVLRKFFISPYRGNRKLKPVVKAELIGLAIAGLCTVALAVWLVLRPASAPQNTLPAGEQAIPAKIPAPGAEAGMPEAAAPTPAQPEGRVY